MSEGMQIAFFGSSLVSAYWNGAATYYRGIVRALAARGHRITFYEPDAYDRQAHRDIPDPEWARVVVYPARRDGEGDLDGDLDGTAGVRRALAEAAGADLVVKASGVGVFDRLLEAAVLDLHRPDGGRPLCAFWDVDAPATLERTEADPTDPFRALIPRYDVVFTYGGGRPVVGAYLALGARRCVPIYNGLDPDIHRPAGPDPRFGGDLGFLGNRLPDREARVDEFFLRPAALRPDCRFVLGGSGWGDKSLPANVRYAGHVYTKDHNAFNASTRAVLNVNRDSMARFGFSPATRVFEAAGAGACLITDAFVGVEQFFTPEREILVARDGAEVARLLAALTPERARDIGLAARARALAAHTYAERARLVEQTLGALDRPRPVESAKRTAVRSGSRPESGGAGCLRGGTVGALDIVVFGLSITSSWGNGHATTYRSLAGALSERGHRVRFFERDVPWYAQNRDMPAPSFVDLVVYDGLDRLRDQHAAAVRDADLVIVGSYVPDGVAIGRWARSVARGHVAFYDIDTPVTLAALERGGSEYLARDQVAAYDLYLSFTGGPTLQRLERELGSPMARPLYCAFDPNVYAPDRRPPRWELGYMGTYSRDRQGTLERLLLEPARRAPEARFVVAGPLYPDDITWPENVSRIAHVSPAGHRAFYCQQRFTLNVTRADMVRAGYSPSVRLFEAAACGVPIISDEWPGLATFFRPHHEILIARSTADVIRYLNLFDAEEAARLGERARRRVLAEHTAAHRAEQLEGYVAELRGQRRASRQNKLGGDQRA